MSLARPNWQATRARVTSLFQAEGGDEILKSNVALQGRVLHHASKVTMHMPATVGDYTGEHCNDHHVYIINVVLFVAYLFSTHIHSHIYNRFLFFP